MRVPGRRALRGGERDARLVDLAAGGADRAADLTHIVICVLALGVFPGSRKPSTAMAWLILVLAVPYFGFLIFLLFGRTSVGRKRREWQLDVNRAGRRRARRRRPRIVRR